MENKIKKNLSKIIEVFILMQPFIDLLTGILVHNNVNLTLGIIIRTVFLAFVMLITVFIFKKKNALFVYLALALYSIFYLLGIIIYKDGVGLFYEIQGLFKIIYFPILLYSLYCLKDYINININTLYKTLIIYILMIFIPTFLDVGYKTYEVTKKGSLGFFNSANEISGIISLLTPIIFIKLKEKKHLFLQSLFFIIYLITILNMGTKTPLLSLGITIGFIFGFIIINAIKKKNYRILSAFIITFIVIFTSILLLLPRTNFYKNIKTHMDFLGVESISEVFTEFNLVDHFIFSQRLTFLSDENYLFKNSSTYQKVFGRGYLNQGEETKLIEMDYFDVFYHHGIIGFIIFFIIYGIVVIKTLNKKKKTDFNQIMLYTSFLLILTLSLFSGHIIIAPSVNIIVISLILKL